MNNLIILATDGSSVINKKNNEYQSSSSCSIYINDERVCDLGVFHYDGTNSLGELYAIVLGLDRLYEIIDENKSLLSDSYIIILSDSNYVVKSLNEYINSWIKQGGDKTWKNSKGNEVAHQSLFKYLYNNYYNGNNYCIENIPIKICHIPGHIKLNNDSESFSFLYKTFIKRNKLDINKNTFCKFIYYNNYADKLAEKIRLEKIIYYEKKGDSKWLKKEKKINTRNGRILILPRKSRKRK